MWRGWPGCALCGTPARTLPLNVVIMAPSAVPATHMETSGAALDAEDLADLLAEGAVYGLAEMMNFPGVVNGAPEVLAKILAFGGRRLDGHAPGLSGHALNAYVAAGVGSEHECTTIPEAEEKLARGLYILIREATNAHNLHNLLPMITTAEQSAHLFLHGRPHPGGSAGPGQRGLYGAGGHRLWHRPGGGFPHGDAEQRGVVWADGSGGDCAGSGWRI